jgi:hypothetical protein
MKKLLLLLLLIPACENSQPVTNAPVSSVQYFDSDPPQCFNADEIEVTETSITCRWDCKMFWTAIYGVGRYDVSRTWLKQDAEVWTMPTNNVDFEHYSDFCINN